MLVACAGRLETADGERLRLTSDEFRGYAEEVFREQNRVATEIAFALEASDRYEEVSLNRLEQADQALFDDCAALNQMAMRRRDGDGRRIFSDAKAARTVPQCERAAAAGIGVLNALEK